jgi:hypothetical protein
MKVLLVLYNEFRTFETTLKTYNIFNHADVDVIVHTQGTEIIKEKIKAKLPNSIIYLEDIDAWKNFKTKNHKSPTKHSFFKIKEILNSLDKHYDLICINRMDSTMYINEIESFLKNYNKNKIYIHQEIIKDKSDWFVPDHFFLGTHESIKYFFDNFTDDIDSHDGVAKYLDALPYENGIWEQGLYSIHIRPNMEVFINENINSDFSNKFFHWMYVDMEHKVLEAEWKGYQI